MKQRITYLLPKGTGLDRDDIKVQKKSLHFTKAFQAAEEWRLTLGLDELPEELQILLRDTHELHIRWAGAHDDGRVSPLVSRVPPGFNAFFTPRTGVNDVPVCDLFEKLLGGKAPKCSSIVESFSRPRLVSERFATSSTYQYFTLTSLRPSLGSVLLSRICDPSSKSGPALDDCDAQIQDLTDANYVDVDFDAISHALTLTAFWSSADSSQTQTTRQRANRPIQKLGEDRLEVGVLQVEDADEPEELKLGGYLTVIGEDDHPSATLFSFPARHHPLLHPARTAFKASFQHPAGLHPKLEITLPRRDLTPPREVCGLHVYLTLPSALFIDRYQLADPIFLSSQNLLAMHMLSGEDDLEAPEWVVKRWGSAALFQVAHPRGTNEEKDWTVTIPMHLRYLNSSAQATDAPHESTLQVPWPVVFWACEAEEGLKMATNPFDRVNLGYESLFGPKTMFYHVPPVANALAVEEIKVPVIDTEQTGTVSSGTIITVVLGFAWVCWQLIRPSKRKVSIEQKTK